MPPTAAAPTAAAAPAAASLPLKLPRRQQIVVVSVEPIERSRRVGHFIVEQLAVAVLIERPDDRVPAEHAARATRAARAAARGAAEPTARGLEFVAREVPVAVAIQRLQELFWGRFLVLSGG